MTAFRVSRIIIFSLVGVVSACVLGLASHVIALSVANDYEDFAYAGLAIAISVMTMTVPAILLIQAVKQNAITIVTEVSWLGFLSLAWIATAGFSLSFSVCDSFYQPRWYKDICVETGAMSGLAVFIMLALIGHVTALLVMSSLSKKHGSSVWKSSVPTAKFKLAASHSHLLDSV